MRYVTHRREWWVQTGWMRDTHREGDVCARLLKDMYSLGINVLGWATCTHYIKFKSLKVSIRKSVSTSLSLSASFPVLSGTKSLTSSCLYYQRYSFSCYWETGQLATGKEKKGTSVIFCYTTFQEAQNGIYRSIA